jgi:hypothetical protein
MRFSLGDSQLCWDSCDRLQFSQFQIIIHNHLLFHMGKMYPQYLPRDRNFHTEENSRTNSEQARFWTAP